MQEKPTVKVVERKNSKLIMRGNDLVPEAIIEKVGDFFRWTNLRGLDKNGNLLHRPPEKSTGTCKTEGKAFEALGFYFKKVK